MCLCPLFLFQRFWRWRKQRQQGVLHSWKSIVSKNKSTPIVERESRIEHTLRRSSPTKENAFVRETDTSFMMCHLKESTWQWMLASLFFLVSFLREAKRSREYPQVPRLGSNLDDSMENKLSSNQGTHHVPPTLSYRWWQRSWCKLRSSMVFGLHPLRFIMNFHRNKRSVERG